jgi:hypothetical protein
MITVLLKAPAELLSIIKVPTEPTLISTLLTVPSTCDSKTTASHALISQSGFAVKDLRNPSVGGSVYLKSIISDSHNIFHS